MASWMAGVSTLSEFKGLVQASLERNDESLQAYGKTFRTQLKAYLIESNLGRPAETAPSGVWVPMDAEGWYRIRGSDAENSVFLDITSGRVWKLYSLMGASESDAFADNWVSRSQGLDHCWLSRKQLLGWEKTGSWEQRGIGLRLVLEAARENFAIHSVRWQKKSNGSVALSTEWYSDGKITVNRGVDVEEVLSHVTRMGLLYSDSLTAATELRDSKLGAFEFDFSQNIDLERFSLAVGGGVGSMKLWLVEVESHPDLRRFKGVDLHTWDRLLLDVGPDFAYVSIPQDGCVNAVPRLAVVQGESNSGRTEIFYDGLEIFA